MRSDIFMLAVIFCARGVAATKCTPPPWALQDGNELKTVLGKDSSNFCTATGGNVVNDNKAMNEKCEKFCQVRGSNVGLPIQLGSSIFGMKLPEMTKVCSAITDTSVLIGKTCKEKGKALHLIEIHMSDLLKKIAEFKAKQVTFKAQQVSASQQLAEELKGQKFSDAMRKTNNPEKPAKLKEKFNEFVTAQKNTDSSKGLSSSMKEVKEASLILKNTMASKLKEFLEYVQECNKMVLGKTKDEHALLDICTQEGTSCVEDESASHVGCCCGINAVTSDSLEIDGTSTYSPSTNSPTTNNATTTMEENIEVCARAIQKSKNSILKEEDKVKGVYKQDNMLKENTNKLKTQYPVYYEQCRPDKRRLEARDVEKDHNVEKAHNAEKEKVWHTNSHPRKLLQCDPQPVQGADKSKTGQVLKVGLSPKVEKSMCDADPVMKNEQMRQACSDFCAPKGVPLLLGSETYGVNLTGSNAVCLTHMGGVLKHDPDLLEQCGKWSRSFVSVESKAAILVKYLHLFRATKDEYRSVLAKDIRSIQSYAVSEEYKKKIKKALNTPQEQIDMINEKLKSAEGRVMEERLQKTIGDLKKATEELSKTLTEKFKDLESFLGQCGDFFVGQGAQDEYLLDLCVQKGLACLDDPADGEYTTLHVTCCCGYHPFSSFGESRGAATIDGIASVKDGRVPQTRRMQEKESDSVDVCAEGWTLAAAEVGEIYARMKASEGSWAIQQETETKLKTKYGEDYCTFEPGQTTIKSGPNPTADNAQGVYSFTGLVFSMLILVQKM